MRERTGQEGAALLTVMLFMVIMLILISAMLTVSGNEILISGLQRDGVRALELAEAAVREGEQRLREGTCCSAFPTSFQSSLMAEGVLGSDVKDVTVTIVPHEFGENTATLEIQGDAVVGRAKRRVSLLVFVETLFGLPDVFQGGQIWEQGSIGGGLKCGDAYSDTWFRYQKDLVCEDGEKSILYAGWRIKKTQDSGEGECAKPNCAEHEDEWFPATRRTIYASDPIGKMTRAWADENPPGGYSGCGTAPEPAFRLTFEDEGLPPYVLANDEPASEAAKTCLYGYDEEPDGTKLPYRHVRETFNVKAYDPNMKPEEQTRWFKTITFEPWYDKYFPKAGDREKSQLLKDNPKSGAIPPFPDFDKLGVSCPADSPSGGGTIAGDKVYGTPESPVVVCLLGPGTWHVSGKITGYGVLIVSLDFRITGTVNWSGTVLVQGDVDVAGGTVDITGGLIADKVVKTTGDFTIRAGTIVANAVPGPKAVTEIAWWER